jgi:hypothetical protein
MKSNVQTQRLRPNLSNLHPIPESNKVTRVSKAKMADDALYHHTNSPHIQSRQVTNHGDTPDLQAGLDI